jgi:sugar phosphate isomerase/epimerase
MRVARELRVDTVVTGIEQTGTDEGAERFMRLVPSVLSLAEAYDIVIALETHGGLITTGVQGVQLLRQLGSEHLKLTYDMANIVYYAGMRPEDDLASMGPDIGDFVAHVHLKDKANMERRDYNFPPFGTGILDFDSVLRLLSQGGALTLEVELDGQPESPQLVDEALAMSIDYLRHRRSLPPGDLFTITL